MFDALMLILTYIWMGILSLMIFAGCIVFVVMARRMMREEQKGGLNA